MSNKSNDSAIAVLLIIVGVAIPFAVGAIGRHNARRHAQADAGIDAGVDASVTNSGAKKK